MRFRSLALAAIAACGSALADATPSKTTKPQFQRALPNVDGKTFSSAIVDFPPGAKAAPHRHGQAFVYAYVLQGAVRSQLDDEAAKVYRSGQDWFEPPGARHKLTENVSNTQPARLLVIFIGNTGDPLKTPDSE